SCIPPIVGQVDLQQEVCRRRQRQRSSVAEGGARWSRWSARAARARRDTRAAELLVRRGDAREAELPSGRRCPWGGRRCHGAGGALGAEVLVRQAQTRPPHCRWAGRISGPIRWRPPPVPAAAAIG